MVISMTGFGKAFGSNDSKKIIVECKSLNSKGLDLNLRLPLLYREMEGELRQIISQSLERGKIDFTITVENLTAETPTKINAAVLKNYMQQLQDISPETSPIELIKMAINMPEVLKTERDELDKEEALLVIKLINEALDNLNRFRKNDGLTLTNEFKMRIKNIGDLLLQVEPLEEERKNNVRLKLKTAIDELSTQIDENRFEQELIYYLEKYDVTEEKVRLKSHLDYFLNTMMSTQENNGRKLGFISQEIGREINTLGSKANQADMQKLVVLMKDELEKIKEQVLNVL
jgi:uncharacterized protein (TIGR00255 family)